MNRYFQQLARRSGLLHGPGRALRTPTMEQHLERAAPPSAAPPSVTVKAPAPSMAASAAPEARRSVLTAPRNEPAPSASSRVSKAEQTPPLVIHRLVPATPANVAEPHRPLPHKTKIQARENRPQQLRSAPEAERTALRRSPPLPEQRPLSSVQVETVAVGPESALQQWPRPQRAEAEPSSVTHRQPPEPVLARAQTWVETIGPDEAETGQRRRHASPPQDGVSAQGRDRQPDQPATRRDSVAVHIGRVVVDVHQPAKPPKSARPAESGWASAGVELHRHYLKGW